ncbi:MAG: complex I subunit 5 family protein [Fervidicoccaceae archaeon]
MAGLPPHLILITILLTVAGQMAIGSILKKPKQVMGLVVAFFVAMSLSIILEMFISRTGTTLDGAFLSSSYLGEFNFIVDYVSGPIAMTILLVSLAISIYAYSYMEKRIKDEGRELLPEMKLFYLLYYIFAISMFASVLSTNLVEFYLFLEVGLISSFVLINNYGYGERRKIAILYLVWTHIGAVLFLVGALAFGYIYGSFNVFDASGRILSASSLPVNISRLVFILMLIGMLVKAAAFGFHLWLPYAHAEAPTPISALLSPLLIGIGPYVIFRFLVPLFPAPFESARVWLAIWGTLTIIYGGLNALFEKDFKRFLAYSSISQMGYLITAVAAGNIYGFIGLIMHYIAHAFGKATLFGSAGSIIYHEDELRDMRKMGGLLKTLPLTGNTALIGFFTITGMPPTIGFWSELFIVRGAVDAFFLKGSIENTVLILLFIGFSLSISYAFYAYKNIFQGPPKFEEKVKEDPLIVGSLITLAIISIVLFVIGPAFANTLAGYLNSLNSLMGGA